jgi:hypothetical protein
MKIADMDLDGTPDIVANAYWASDFQGSWWAAYTGAANYRLNLDGQGGDPGIVFWLNSSN